MSQHPTPQAAVDFYFNVIEGEQAQSCRLISQIRHYHPTSRIVVISDGYAANADIFCQDNVFFVEGEHLKRHGHVGMFTTRNLSTALALTNAGHIIKLDPDSGLVRRVPSLPFAASWLGRVVRGKTPWGTAIWANGGGFAISRSAANQILASGYLLLPCYADKCELEVNAGRCWEDWRLGHVANSLGIYPSEHPSLIAPTGWRNVKSAIVHPFL